MSLMMEQASTEDSTTMSNTLTCKTCKKKFSYDDWKNNTNCTNPNCKCPQVQNARQMTDEIVSKLKEKAKNKIDIQINDVPHGYEKTKAQYYYPMPKVMTGLVTPPNGKK